MSVGIGGVGECSVVVGVMGRQAGVKVSVRTKAAPPPLRGAVADVGVAPAATSTALLVPMPAVRHGWRNFGHEMCLEMEVPHVFY